MARPGDPPRRDRRGLGRYPQPPSNPVRHPYWKYPLLSLAALVLILALAGSFGSPNFPRDTIAGLSNADPGGSVLAFTQELDGTASSWHNTRERGFGQPDQVFVLDPLSDFGPLLGSSVQSAVATYRAAGADKANAWADAYDKALAKITPDAGTSTDIQSPDYTKVGALQGDFGPVPTLVQADLTLARDGHLEHFLNSQDPGHSFHMSVIWLYDHPAMLNTASANGLTDDQYGIVKERGFGAGPWYLILPNVIHVKFWHGATGGPFVAWNLFFAVFFMFGLTLIPGLRDLPRRLGLYRLVYRYPAAGDISSKTVAAEPSTPASELSHR
jgi:hypothetical protein